MVPVGSHQLKLLLSGAFWIISVGFEAWILEAFLRVIRITVQGCMPPPPQLATICMQWENKTITTSKERKALQMEISYTDLGREGDSSSFCCGIVCWKSVWHVVFSSLTELPVFPCGFLSTNKPRKTLRLRGPCWTWTWSMLIHLCFHLDFLNMPCSREPQLRELFHSMSPPSF